MSVYLLLCGDGELVAGNQAGHLLHAQIEKLFAPNYLGEVLLCQQKHEMKNKPLNDADEQFFFSPLSTLIKPVLILSYSLSYILQNTPRQ